MSNSLTHTDHDITEQDSKLAAAEKKNLGNIAFKELSLDEALTLYDEAIAMDPTQMSFYNNKGGMSNTLTHTDHDNTEEDWKLAAAEKKNLGNIAFKEQRLDEALTLYDEAITMDPTQMSFYNNKGAVYIHKKEFLLAKNVCSDALTIGQRYGGSSADKARSLARIGKACLQMGDIYNATWKYDEALTTLETDYEAVMVDKVTPQPVPSSKNVKVDEIQKQAAVKKKELGNKAYQKGQYDKALALYNEAIELDPTQISFYNNKGAVYIQRKDFISSKNVCLEAVRIEPFLELVKLNES
ncbi:stress-induced-phosphoprotein 1-like [Bolinopsis microptera]|uniref:stress-induced-phosphoprotein 1-like n=1 Tax=Bolinopsis microptera TaxID=2820187 RepID=UPI00307AAB99